MVNSAKAPNPSGAPADPQTVGVVMQFRVGTSAPADTTFNPATDGSLRGGIGQPPAIVRLANPSTGGLASGVTPSVKRQLVLVEVEGPGGPVEVLLNNSKWDGLRDGTQQALSTIADGAGNYVTETPQLGSTEVWEIINTTADAHPIHVHLVQFQLLNRQPFSTQAYRKKYDSLFPGGSYPGVTSSGGWARIDYAPGTYIPSFGPPQKYGAANADGAVGGNPAVRPYLQGSPAAPDPNEAGWKDTIKMFPGQVSRVAIRWAPQDLLVDSVQAGDNKFPFDPTTGPGYVWHCHILDHEDNEMMRPLLPQI